MNANVELTLNQDRVPDASGTGATFDSEIRRLTDEFARMWDATTERRPGFAERYTEADKRKNEGACERLLEKAKSLAGDDRDFAGARFKLQRQIADILFAPDDQFARQFSSECGDAATIFVRRAKRLDPLVREADVHQALRNFWTFNSLQSYLSSPVALTASSFAYSLLYPYTDNVLDALDKAGEKKSPFLHWLDLALQGNPLPAHDRLTKIVGRLLRMIEEEYPRPDFPEVHYSLMAIHQAQRESLSLCTLPEQADEANLLGVTVAKGGTSVLADGFLVHGCLETVDKELLFGYGVLLQLIDDFRDIEEDNSSGISTPFTRIRKEEHLDGSTNRLFDFLEKIVALLKRRPSGPEHQICRMIEQSCRFLIQEGIARNPGRYSEEYIDWIGEFIPVPVSYLGGLRSRLKKEERDGVRQVAEL